MATYRPLTEKQEQLTRTLGTLCSTGFTATTRHSARQRSRQFGPLLVVVSAILTPAAVWAQVGGGLGEPLPGGVTRPGEVRPALPEFEAPEPAPLALPPVQPVPPESGRLPAGLQVFVREFRLRGNTVFSAQDLKAVTAPYENRTISSEELEAVRQGLTLFYVNRGYINSGAVIPDQQVVDGVVEILIVEGQLSDIRVTGNERLRSEYISDRLALGAGPPLNVNALQERVQLLLQSPFIERINAELGPGDRPGTAELVTRIKEGRPYQVVAVADNRLSPTLGEVRGVLQGYVYSPTGSGDVLSAEFGLAEGLKPDVKGNYTIPLNPRDTAFNAFFEYVDSEVVKGVLEPLDIEAKTRTVGFRFSHPFYRTRNEQFSMSAGLDWRESKTYLLGEGFSFAPGVPPDGESKVTVVRWTQDWLSRSPTRVLAARSTFSLGIDAFDATVNDDGPDGKFLAWLGQFQWAHRLGDRGNQLILRADAQLAGDPLLPMEQFAVGGALSVRGYRHNLLVRDSGFDASLEFRTPLLRDAVGRSTLQLAAFVDGGGAWFHDREEPAPKTIASAGLGLRWDPTPRVHGEVYWGYALKDVDVPDDTIQDNGWHFLFSANLFD